ADLHGLPIPHDDFGDGARHLRGNLGVDLVGHHLEERVVLLDLIALLDQPALDGPFRYGLTELRHLDRSCHALLFLVLPLSVADQYAASARAASTIFSGLSMNQSSRLWWYGTLG